MVGSRNKRSVQAKPRAPSWGSLGQGRSRAGVRLGPRYPWDSSLLQIALPRIVPMSDDQFARAVEVLTEMLSGRMETAKGIPLQRIA